MQYPLSQQGFQMAVSIDDELPSLVGDADALEQAILNLLTNAIRYSGDARDIELCLKRIGDEAVIEVTDHGIGIPHEEHSRIFDKFYRVRSTTTEPVAGTGLGLTLALHIVNAHGGRIEVTSAVGAGSTFSVRIPLNRTEGRS
jgi:signal transduction histidine kinase